MRTDFQNSTLTKFLYYETEQKLYYPFYIIQKINPPVGAVLLNRIIKAPIDDAFKALKVDYSEAVRRLETNGISIGGATTIERIWINNNADPEKVTDLIMEQE